MDKIRWGIIGTGKIANTFAQGLCNVEDAVLEAVASRDIQKANLFADKYGFEKAYGSYAELAADKDIDVVYIATPMSSHLGDTLLCLDSGRNVLCEKSMTLNSEQLAKMFERAHEKDLFLMEAMWMKCRPSFLKAREWIQAGRIGNVKVIRADFCNLCPYDPDDRLFRPDCGGGSLLDLGIYPITFAADILGYSPKEIISSAYIAKDRVDHYASVLMRYEGGAFADLSMGFDFQCENTAVIIGDEGSITFGKWFHCTDDIVLYDTNSKEIERFHCSNGGTGYEYEIEEVHSCLRKGLKESPLVPHSETASIMKIMDTCRSQWGMTFPEEE